MKSSTFAVLSSFRLLTPSFVAGEIKTGGGVASIASTSVANVAGNTLIILTSNYTTGRSAVSTITDGSGNTWYKAGNSIFGDGNHTFECWFAPNIKQSAGNSVTVNFAATANSIKVYFGEFANLNKTITCFDQQSTIKVDGAATTTHTTNSTSALVSQSELVVGIYVLWGGTGYAYTPSDCTSWAGDGTNGNAYYAIRTDMQSQNLTVATATGNQQAMGIWTFAARKA